MHQQFREVLSLSRVAALAAFAFVAPASQGQAAAAVGTSPSNVYQAGGVNLTIPPPTGELAEMGANYRSMMDPFVPDSNRLVAAFLLPDDLRSFQSGKRVGLRRYALVEVPRSDEFTVVSADDFQNAANAVDKQFGSTGDSGLTNNLVKQEEDELNRKLKALNLNSPKTTLGKPVMLGKFFSKANVYCFGMVTQVSSSGSTVNMLIGVLLMRVNSRILYVYVYTEYNGDETVPWIQRTTMSWADAILSGNSQ